jgi:hypothetical protein
VIDILPQPDDSSCGPTCLHAVYAHFGDVVPLARVISEVAPLPTGGTLGVALACHALARGYDAEVFTYNLQLFDPSWFEAPIHLERHLGRQRQVKTDAKLHLATDAYREFLRRGGRLQYRELGVALVAEMCARGPVLTGLSATYLYGCARETLAGYDAIAGEPAGHFVVFGDHDPFQGTVAVADPLKDNPRFGTQHYRVGVERLIGAVLLGMVTYDANLLLIRPK